MLRLINICLVIGLVALACVIYHVKYEARALEYELAAIAAKIEDERDTIAVLRAEWSLLNRPERIERLAKKYLHLESSRPQQIVTLDSLTASDFARGRTDAPAPATATPKTRSPSGPSVATTTVPKGSREVLPWAKPTLPWLTATIAGPIRATGQ